MKLLYRIIFLIGFLAILGFVIAYARGYRLDLEKRTMTSTGILAISAYPKAAKIYVNNEFKGVTDQNIVLSPGNYQVDIKKDGYTSFSKKISIKGELVVTLEPNLFPINPALSPLTNLGIIQAIPVDGTDRVIIFVDKGIDDPENKNGIYLFEGDRRPLAFFQSLNKIILKTNLTSDIDFSNVNIIFSPDTKEAIFEFDKVAYLLSLETENLTPYDVTSSKETLINAWEEKRMEDNLKVMETFPVEFTNIASESVKIISFAPNDTKVLYLATKNFNLPLIIDPPLIAGNQTQEERSINKGKIYIYDRKEDKNYLIANNQPPITNNQIQWYFDSKHLLINGDKKITVVDYDGTNEQIVYSGPFENNFFSSTNDGRIIVLINLNSQVNELPDLYLVGIR